MHFVAHSPFFCFPNECSPEVAIRVIHSMKLAVGRERMDWDASVALADDEEEERKDRWMLWGRTSYLSGS